MGVSQPSHFIPMKEKWHLCTGSWVGPGPVWTGAENLTTTGIRSADHPARSESSRQWHQFQINKSTRVLFLTQGILLCT